MTPLFKNCISSKFQPSRPCVAIVVVKPILEEKNFEKIVFIDFQKVHFVENPQFSS